MFATGPARRCKIYRATRQLRSHHREQILLLKPSYIFHWSTDLAFRLHPKVLSRIGKVYIIFDVPTHFVSERTSRTSAAPSISRFKVHAT
jgi:hypothetical protein